MKYVQGKSLKQIILELTDGNEETHKRFPFIKRAELMVQLLRTLCDLHEKNIVHRDIKPDNILINKENPSQLCLIDFGISEKYIENGQLI